MPSIAFGTWTLGNGQNAIDQVTQGLEVGFAHVGTSAYLPRPLFHSLVLTPCVYVTDTAQSYRNEAEAGQAIKESGLARDEIFVTTKWSGSDGLDVPTSIRNSVKNVGFSDESPS